LVVGNSIEPGETEYLTLSHCWGDGNIFKLEKGNIESLQKGLPMNKLSQTFKDAMTITNTLGYRFLWIDALCIIQDSKEDWAMEGGRMAQVYGNATLNLAACNPSRDSGLFEDRNPLGYFGCKIASLRCNLFAEPESRQFPAHLPLFTRGWIMQERFLSRRNLYFGTGELHWECFNGIAVETLPRGIALRYDEEIYLRTLYGQESKHLFEKLLKQLRCLRNRDTFDGLDPLIGFATCWNKLVQTYSRSKLTVSSDRLAGLAGIVSIIARETSFVYISGMWIETLPATLLWIKDEIPLNASRVDQHAIEHVPSWSWIKVDASVFFSYGSGSWEEKLIDSALDITRFRATLLGYDVKRVESKSAVFGEVTRAKLHLRGVLRRIEDWSQNSTKYRCKCREGFGKCEDLHTVFSGQKVPVEFIEDSKKVVRENLLFFTLFRASASTIFFEEGLVIASHLDGFVRVGFMRIGHSSYVPEELQKELLWGDGQIEEIFLY
jgi:Heterokaryon incompatibility protein (HET)